MPTNAYLGYFAAIPVGALIAQYVTAWRAGFKPRYIRCLASTLITYVALNLVGAAFYFFGRLNDFPVGLQLLVALVVLSCCHLNLLRSEAGARLTGGKAIVIALCQVFGAIITLVFVLLVVVAFRRLIQ